MFSQQSQGITVLTESMEFGLFWEEPRFFLTVVYTTKHLIHPQIIKYCNNEKYGTLHRKLKCALPPNPKM